MHPVRGAAPAGLALRIRAPAKINWHLRVLGRRPDGTHELESLFLPLDLADEVELWLGGADAAGSGVELELASPETDLARAVPRDASNLAVRAARGFLDAAGLRRPVRLRLEKRIPAAAGLGGGSSDAGAVLRALSALLPGALPPEALAALALRLGADVPFFLDPRPALVRGVGERIEPRPGQPARALLLANPGLPLATAEVFRAFDALGPARGGSARPAGEGLSGAEPANDLEPAAVRLCPPLARLRAALRRVGARGVRMSGSGPTLFGAFDDAAGAAAGLARLEELELAPRVWARVASTVHS